MEDEQQTLSSFRMCPSKHCKLCASCIDTTYTACVVWCGIGQEELMQNTELADFPLYLKLLM